jgi:hypothetical protein
MRMNSEFIVAAAFPRKLTLLSAAISTCLQEDTACPALVGSPVRGQALLLASPETCHCTASLTLLPSCAVRVVAGRTRITLRRTGELYSHVPPSAKVHNLVLGKTWIDSFGPFHVRNTNTGVRVEMEFKPCGWFGSGQYEFEGLVLDEQVRHGVLVGLHTLPHCCCHCCGPSLLTPALCIADATALNMARWPAVLLS